MQTGNERRSPHHSIPSLESMRRTRSRTDEQGFFAATIQDDEKLIIAPASEKSVVQSVLSRERATTRNKEEAASGPRLARKWGNPSRRKQSTAKGT